MKNTENCSLQNHRFEIRISGSGGQGVILAGIILAEAATLDKKHVAQSQSYGPEARGGSSMSEVIISDEEIDFPRASKLDILVALTQEALGQNLPDLKTDGLLVVDSDLVHNVPWEKVLRICFRQIARNLGEERAINMAALGSVVAVCRYAQRNSVSSVIAQRLPPSKVEVNLKAFAEALQLTQESNETLCLSCAKQ